MKSTHNLDKQLVPQLIRRKYPNYGISINDCNFVQQLNYKKYKILKDVLDSIMFEYDCVDFYEVIFADKIMKNELYVRAKYSINKSFQNNFIKHDIKLEYSLDINYYRIHYKHHNNTKKVEVIEINDLSEIKPLLDKVLL